MYRCYLPTILHTFCHVPCSPVSASFSCKDGHMNRHEKAAEIEPSSGAARKIIVLSLQSWQKMRRGFETLPTTGNPPRPTMRCTYHTVHLPCGAPTMRCTYHAVHLPCGAPTTRCTYHAVHLPQSNHHTMHLSYSKPP